MLCEKCGQREATRIIDFALLELNLCDTCYATLSASFEAIPKLTTRFPATREFIQQMVAEDSRFSDEAFEFVIEAMHEASTAWCSEHRTQIEFWLRETLKVKAAPISIPATLRIPARKLATALRRLASRQFGKCAADVFKSWGVTRWGDFGEIVSRLQRAKVPGFEMLEFREDDFAGRGVLDDIFPEC